MSTCTFNATGSNADAPAADQSHPLTTMPFTILHELAEECMCPISQALMVDPVIAADGHTYDRTQIEKWFRQQEHDGQTPPTSPQTREPLSDQRLVSNMALRRTIERLVNSGRLDVRVADEWRAVKEASRQTAMNAIRERSLACAPIGTRVAINVLLVPCQEANVENEILLGSRSLADMRVDLHVATQVGGGGLFGNASPTRGRLLISNLSVGAAVCCLEVNDRSLESVEKIKCILQDPPSLPPSGSMPEDALLAAVFPQSPGLVHHSDDSGACFTETCLALEHIVRRLATIENGLPSSVQAEWKVLDKELQARRRRSKLSSLRFLLGLTSLKTNAVVNAVDDNGVFTLAFPCFTQSPELAEGSNSNEAMPMTQAPSDFIGPGGVVADPQGPRRQRTSLFGAPAAGGGLFGQSTAASRTASPAALPAASPTDSHDSQRDLHRGNASREDGDHTPSSSAPTANTSEGLFGGSAGGLFGGNADNSVVAFGGGLFGVAARGPFRGRNAASGSEGQLVNPGSTTHTAEGVLLSPGNATPLAGGLFASTSHAPPTGAGFLV